MSEDLYLQVNYLRRASGSLSMFKDKGHCLFNFRCPFCGDSVKSKTKARGYIVRSPVDGLLLFKCHNCDEVCGFQKFLKFINIGLYKQYCFEAFKGLYKPDRVTEDVMKIDTTASLGKKLEGSDCINVNKLSRLHQSNKYLLSRKIPKERYSKFYYTDDFESFVESIGHYMDVPSEPRLMLFETDKFGNIKLIVARSLEENAKVRYLTIRVDEEYPKLFGLSATKTDDLVYVVEGAIDSLFLDNCIATLDANFSSKNIKEHVRNPVYILDNEPRSSIIAKKLKKLIDDGESVVVFDDQVKVKDINDMALAGVDLKSYISSRTFKGIQAVLEYRKWNKT